MPTRFVLQLALPLFVIGAVRAQQVPTVLLREGDVVAPGRTVARINRNDTNRLGGWVTLVVADDPSGNKVSLAWGSPDGVQAPTLLQEEAVQAGYTQTNWRLGTKMDDQGLLGYQADLAGNLTSIWHGVTPIAVQNEPASVAGTWGGGLNDAGVTDSGQPWFQDGGKGLFLGPSATPVYLLGDPLPGTSDSIGALRKFAFASDAAHHIVTLNRNAPSGNQVFVLDGSGLTIGGFLLEVGVALPPQLDGDGGALYNFVHAVDVNDGGDWAAIVRRQKSNGGLIDEILQNGQIRYRKGDVIDGVLLMNFRSTADLTDRGELLHVWEGNVFNSLRMFVDDDLVVAEGQLVDLDGDGVAEPNARVMDSPGLEDWDATLSADGWIYFAGEVEVIEPSGPVRYDSFLRVSRSPAPTSYCTPKLSSSGCAAVVRTSDPDLAPVAGAGGYSLFATTVEGQRNGLFFWGANGPVAAPFLGGTLCVQPPLNRTPIQTSGGNANTCSGTFALELNGGEPWNLGPGQSTWWQAWYRDPDLADGFDVALSNAIEVQAR